MGKETETGDYNGIHTALAGLRTFAKSNKKISQSAPILYNWLRTIPEKNRWEFSSLATKVTKYYLRVSNMTVDDVTYRANINEAVASGLQIGEDAGKKSAAMRKARNLAELFKLKLTALDEKVQ